MESNRKMNCVICGTPLTKDEVNGICTVCEAWENVDPDWIDVYGGEDVE